jgi:hypothetical protein
MPLKIQAVPSQTVSQCHDRTLGEGGFKGGFVGDTVWEARSTRTSDGFKSDGFKSVSGMNAIGVGCSMGAETGAEGVLWGGAGGACFAEAGSDFCRSQLGIILSGWIGTEFDRRFGSTRFGSTKLKDEARVLQDFPALNELSDSCPIVSALLT